MEIHINMDFGKYFLKNHLQELELDYFAVIREITELFVFWRRAFCTLYEHKHTVSYCILLSINERRHDIITYWCNCLYSNSMGSGFSLPKGPSSVQIQCSVYVQWFFYWDQSLKLCLTVLYGTVNISETNTWKVYYQSYL